MASLLIIRHGHTKLNGTGESAEKIRGHVDIPLDSSGRREALGIAAKYGGLHPARVYCSDLSRAHDTAMPLARACQCPLLPTFDLRPWDLGYMTGKDVHKVLPLMNKLVEHPTVPVPDGESFQSYADRYLPFLRRLLSEAGQSSRPVIAVTHSRNVQLAKAWDKAGRPAANRWDNDRMMDYKEETPPGGHYEMKP